MAPKVFGDHRGYFMETYNERDFIEAGLDMSFVQDNHSKSLEYQEYYEKMYVGR